MGLRLADRTVRSVLDLPSGEGANQVTERFGQQCRTANETKSPTSGPRSAGDDPAKVRQILDGARKVFLNLGFDGASMGDIARAAGVSKGTLYVYFENKAELFSALIADERKHAQA